MNTRYATFFTHFFIEAVPNLGKVDERYLCDASKISHPIEKAIYIYIKKSSKYLYPQKNGINKNIKFSFEPITRDDIPQ